jgi:TPR repeat protein
MCLGLSVTTYAQHQPMLPSLSRSGYQQLLERAQKGDINHQLQLGSYLEYGIAVPRDLLQAEFWLRRAAEMGSPEAQLQLGMLYLQPEMGREHGNDAMRWFTRAAISGLALAEYNLALMHLRGLGTPVNRVEAERWLRKAVRHRVEAARSRLGRLLLEDADPERQREGFMLIRDSAKAGEAGGLNALAYCFESGTGTAADMKKAASLYHRAARAGSTDAMHSLGDLYSLGKGVQKDLQEAFTWDTRGCNAGDAASCWSLGYMYLDGEGVQQDLVLGYAYASVAHGNVDLLSKIATRMSQEDRNKALAEAEKWERDHVVQMSSLPRYEIRVRKLQVADPVQEGFLSEEGKQEKRNCPGNGKITKNYEYTKFRTLPSEE